MLLRDKVLACLECVKLGSTEQKKLRILLGMLCSPFIPGLGRLRLESCCKFRLYELYTVYFRPTWAALGDLISKQYTNEMTQ